MLDFCKTSYTDFVLELNEFLRLVGAPTESQGIIIIYYMYGYAFWDQNILPRGTSEPKKPFKGTILAKLVKRT